jgi:hypothetical protein
MRLWKIQLMAHKAFYAAVLGDFPTPEAGAEFHTCDDATKEASRRGRRSFFAQPSSATHLFSDRSAHIEAASKLCPASQRDPKTAA